MLMGGGYKEQIPLMAVFVPPPPPPPFLICFDAYRNDHTTRSNKSTN
jgi:hypothetical protein